LCEVFICIKKKNSTVVIYGGAIGQARAMETVCLHGLQLKQA
jgi:hypothetical protein